MKDDLKNFVEQHRSEFEVFKPESEEIWQQISTNLDEQNPTIYIHHFLRPYYKVAAVIVLAMGVLLYMFRSDYGFNQTEVASLSAELGETQEYYQGLINEKMEFIQANSNLIDPVVLDDIDLMDQAFRELKEDLAENVDNEEVVNAMIKNYRIKLQILERILGEIENKETTDETNTSI